MHRARKILVTGGAGFIGSNFVHDRLRHSEDDITVLDALTYAGHWSSIQSAQNNPRFRFVHGNVVNYELVSSLLAERNIDTIVHFAAETHVDRSIASPQEFVESNVLGTQQLLSAARNYWLGDGSKLAGNHHFHHVSTDEVFGSRGASEQPCPETAVYQPNSPYAATKAASDHLVRAFHRTFGLRVTTSHCSNNYGPFQGADKFIPLTITRVLTGKEIPVYGSGAQIRDWLHVDDHIVCIGMILEKGRLGQTYNICSGSGMRNVDVVEKICRILDDQFFRDKTLRERFPMARHAIAGNAVGLLRHVADRPGHDYRYAIDGSRSRMELGFQSRVSIDAGLELTVQWYLDHSRWWQEISI